MTVVEDELLSGERTHAVREEDDGPAGLFVLRDDPQRDHVLDELIKATKPEVAQAPCGRGESMTSVIVAVDDKACADQYLG
jgi:hypothetical protein